MLCFLQEIVSRCDPDRNGMIARKDICDAMQYTPKGQVTFPKSTWAKFRWLSVICSSLTFSGELLRGIRFLKTDMAARKADSVATLVAWTMGEEGSRAVSSFVRERTLQQTLDHHFLLQAKMHSVKDRLAKIYGPGWNVFMVEGQYSSICAHKPGSNLVFTYKGVVYGVYQTPDE